LMFSQSIKAARAWGIVSPEISGMDGLRNVGNGAVHDEARPVIYS
jgi:hypothetical protein